MNGIIVIGWLTSMLRVMIVTGRDSLTHTHTHREREKGRKKSENEKE